MDLGDVGPGFRRRSGGEAKSEITRGNRRIRRDDIGGSSRGSDRNRSAQLRSGSAIWLLGNLEFSKRRKMRFSRHGMSMWSVSVGNVRKVSVPRVLRFRLAGWSS
jgi:hypothetical protein